MEAFQFVMYCLAALCFGVAAANVAVRINLLALGLLFWVMTLLVPAIQGL